MTNEALRERITKIADDFVSELLEAVRGLPLEELLAVGEAGGRAASTARTQRAPAKAPAGRPAGTRTRRSLDDIGAVADRIIQVLKANKQGMRAEALRLELGLSRDELVRPLAYAAERNKITKKGQKRATTYFAR